MSRLAHLQKRKVDKQYNHKQQNNYQQHNVHQSSPTHENVSNNQQNYRPIFDPTNTIKIYDRSQYKKGDHSYPPPETLYEINNSEIDPLFIRTTSTVLHTQPRKTMLPIAAWISPFASQKVHTVDLHTPLRCNRCKAYVNPFFQFDGSKRIVTCNMCGLRFNIEQNIDKANITSTQIATQSIVDFRVTDKFYLKKKTNIVKFLIAIELSMPTIELGIVSTIIQTLKSIMQSHEFQKNIRVGILFYSDQGIGYLRNQENVQSQCTIFLVPNNKNNTFCCPLSDDQFLLNPSTQSQHIIANLEFLQGYSQKIWKQGKFSHQANYINAIKSIKQSFENQTGKIVLFSLMDPRVGPCSIRPRNQEQLKLPLKPLNLQVLQLGKELVRLRIGVQHYFFSKDNLITHELATMHFLSSLTGGQLHYYSTYNSQTHGQHLYYSIFNSITKKTYFDIDFTCRSSNGLSVLRYGAPDGIRESRDVGQSIVSSSSSFIVEFDQQQKLQQNVGAFLQFALMYTTGNGQRKIRVITYRFNVSPRIEDLYESSDYLTIANVLARSYSFKLLKTQPNKIRQDAINWMGLMIGEAKKSCPQIKSGRIGDLSIPHSMIWMFSYIHSLINSKMFLNYFKMTSDGRIYQYLKIHNSNPYFFSNRYYPRVYPITLDIYEGEPLPGDFIDNQQEDNQNEDAVKIAVLPKNLPLSKQYFSDQGVYLYDGGDQIIILVQTKANEELLIDLFNTSNWQQIEAEGLPALQTSHNIRVHNIIQEIRRRGALNNGMYQPLVVKTGLRKGPYGDLFSSILRQDYYDCNFSSFIGLITKAIQIPK